jgi:hypothetical protein
MRGGREQPSAEYCHLIPNTIGIAIHVEMQRGERRLPGAAAIIYLQHIASKKYEIAMAQQFLQARCIILLCQGLTVAAADNRAIPQLYHALNGEPVPTFHSSY